MMKRAGYKPHVAAAIEACASTGGQLMPPVMGIAAFVMAEFLQIPYADVAIAAVIPAILYYLALFIQVDLEAARSNIAPMDPSQLPRMSKVLKSGWQFPIPFAVLIYTLFWMGDEAEMAGLLATATVLVLAVIFPFSGKRIGFRDVYEMLRETGLTILDLFMIGAAAGIIIGTLNYSGIGFSFTLSLLHLGGDTLIGLLVLAAIASIILGMGMPTVGVYILLATLIAPALIQMKIEPIAAHMFILYFGCLSMITPPVAIGAFAAANLADAEPMRTGYVSMAFGWTAFLVPFLFVYSDALLMRGSVLEIAARFRHRDGRRLVHLGGDHGLFGAPFAARRPGPLFRRRLFPDAAGRLFRPARAGSISPAPRWRSCCSAGSACAAANPRPSPNRFRQKNSAGRREADRRHEAS